MHKNDFFTCLVCGFAGLTSAPYDASGCASFDICPSCGTEFGYDDASKSHRELRQLWLAAGAPWRSSRVSIPEGWNAVDQIRAAGLGD